MVFNQSVIMIFTGQLFLLGTCTAITMKCSHDYDCFSKEQQFCDHGICTPCIDCKKYNRNTGLKWNCLKDIKECGSCSDGFQEVQEGFSYGKKCIPRREPLSSNMQERLASRNTMNVGKHSTKSTPSNAVEIAVTVGVVAFVIAAAAGMMVGVYIYMHRNLVKAEQEEESKSPRVIELQPMVINNSTKPSDDLSPLHSERPLMNNEDDQYNVEPTGPANRTNSQQLVPPPPTDYPIDP